MKWCILLLYRPPNQGNTKIFFEEATHPPNKMASRQDNIIITKVFNINTSCRNDKLYYLTKLCNFFYLSNLICRNTSSKLSDHTSVNLILTKGLKSFQKISAISTGFSELYNMILTFLNLTSQSYTNCKYFNLNDF